jgi:drug/metabolite transporter (DMT)-like permease
MIIALFFYALGFLVVSFYVAEKTRDNVGVIFLFALLWPLVLPVVIFFMFFEFFVNWVRSKR